MVKIYILEWHKIKVLNFYFEILSFILFKNSCRGKHLYFLININTEQPFLRIFSLKNLTVIFTEENVTSELKIQSVVSKKLKHIFLLKKS